MNGHETPVARSLGGRLVLPEFRAIYLADALLSPKGRGESILVRRVDVISTG